jgi:hypothetical protein
MVAQRFGSARRAFQMIIIGALICFIDLTYSHTINGVGYRIDLVNDAVGTLLIAAGIWRLAAVYVSDRYRRLMAFVRLATAAAVLLAIRSHWIGPVGPAARVFWWLTDTLASMGTPAFFLAMSMLWRSLAPPRLAPHWRWAAAGTLAGLVLLLLVHLAGFWRSLFQPETAAPAIELGGTASLLATLLWLAPLALGAVTFWRGYRALGRQPAAAIIPPLIAVAPEPAPRRWPLAATLAALTLALVAGGGYGGFVALRPPPQAREVGRVHVVGDQMAENGASFSPDGTRILSQTDATVEVRDAATGATVVSIVPAEWPNGASYDPSGQRIVTVRYSVQFWDAATGQLLRESPPSRDDNRRPRFSPDGRFVATLCADALCIYDATTGNQALRVLQQRDGAPLFPRDLAYSPDGQTIAVAFSDRIVLLDPGSGAVLLTIDLSDTVVRRVQADGSVVTVTGGGVRDLDWSPDGSRLASINFNQTVAIWDPRSGQLLREIALVRRLDTLLSRYHGSDLGVLREGGIAWSPDGVRLAISLDDGFAGIWDVASGEQRWRLGGHTKRVTKIAWHPGGQRVLISGQEGEGIVWDVSDP